VFSQYHRLSETEPFQTRFDYEDASSHILFDEPGRSVITEKGFRMAKANVAAREGRFYWECKILSGVKPAGPEAAAGDAGGHARIGFSRREAHLDTPVGFDAYSYGLRDVAGQKVHMSRPKNFMPAGEDFCEGDVIGLEINLPSLGLHRKVMDGTYNKAVDVSDEVEPQGAAASDIIRDRLPIRYKSHLYFEQCEYSSSKELEDLMNPSPVITTTLTTTTIAPNPNHPSAQLRTLPFSSIKVYKNGRYVGSPFTDLLAFLPPASKPVTQVGAREGLDDGTLGYYPSVSVFRGGAVEANFGPDFWFPPPELANSDDDVDMIGESEAPGATEATPAATLRRLRPFSERYNEQIAEDVVYDIIDEVDLWSLHGGKTDGKKGVHAAGAAGLDLGLGDSSAVGADAAAASAEVTIKTEQTDDIKEIVQEDE
jgi:COMPASS component BRE2